MILTGIFLRIRRSEPELKPLYIERMIRNGVCSRPSSLEGSFQC